MDRQKLDLLTAQANALASGLCSIPDANDHARQRCLNLATEVKSFIKGWSNLSKALHDPTLEPRPAFTQIIDRILLDCSKIVNDLRSQLADVRAKQSQFDAAVRQKRWMPRNKTAHLLVQFLGRETIALRQQQIYYAISVLDVLLGVVFHAKSLGEQTTRQDAQASLQDQLARLRAEADARTLVFKEERRIGDKYVISSLWLNSVTWHSDSFEAPPFETLALQWFKIVAEVEANGRRETDISLDANNLTKVVMQLQQDLREQSKRHQDQVQEHSHQYQALRTWAEGTIGQLEFSQQKAAREAASRLEEMKNQLEVQKQKIEADSAKIEQLKHSRNEWTSHYQKQSQVLQQLEAQMKDLKKENGIFKQACAQQQQRIEDLQHKYESLRQSYGKMREQNQALHQRLRESEAEKQDLEDKNAQLQNRLSKAVQHNKRWKELYDGGPAERDEQIAQLQADIQVFKKEVATLKHDLSNVTVDRNHLRDSLKKVEGERNTERIHSRSLQERLAGRKSVSGNDCPNAYDNTRSSPTRRRSRSRSRSDSIEPSTSTSTRSASRATTSRASSSTYVDDAASDYEHYANSLPRKISGGESTTKIGSWFTPRRTLVVKGR